MICQAACDHRRPCSSFLTNSFFSCKDRALERDRPYQREKKNQCPFLLLPIIRLRSLQDEKKRIHSRWRWQRSVASFMPITSHKFEPQADNSQPEPSPCGDGSGSHVSLCPISTFHLPHGSVIAGWDSVQVSVRMLPVRLALCDLEAPGWGEPWFPHCAFVASWLTDYCMAFL